MEFSEFTFRLVVIFIPGLISFFIIENLTAHKEFKFFKVVLYTLLLGFINYILYYFLTLIDCLDLQFLIFDNISDVKPNPNSFLDIKSIIYTSIIAIPCGLFFSFVINRKILHWFANLIKCSNKFGDLDVWSYILNSKISNWVWVRDPEVDLMYFGYISAFSDSEGYDELFLREVEIYVDSTGEKLYEKNGLYLARPREKIRIEFEYLTIEDELLASKKK